MTDESGRECTRLKITLAKTQRSPRKTDRDQNALSVFDALFVFLGALCVLARVLEKNLSRRRKVRVKEEVDHG
jgi:hypothetical protein